MSHVSTQHLRTGRSEFLPNDSNDRYRSGERLPIREQEARHIGSLLHALAGTEEGISRLRLEIESESVLSLSLAGVETELVFAEEALEEELEAEAEEVEEKEAVEAVRLNPGTRRWVLASILYHAEEPVTVGEVVALSEGEEWEMGQSAASAELYNMYQEDLVDRDGSPYEYELTERGEERLVQRSREESVPIEPNPFADPEPADS